MTIYVIDLINLYKLVGAAMMYDPLDFLVHNINVFKLFRLVDIFLMGLCGTYVYAA